VSRGITVDARYHPQCQIVSKYLGMMGRPVSFGTTFFFTHIIIFKKVSYIKIIFFVNFICMGKIFLYRKL
jgi:hypothetical protein